MLFLNEHIMLQNFEVRQDLKQLFTSSSLVVGIAAVCFLPRIGLLCYSENTLSGFGDAVALDVTVFWIMFKHLEARTRHVSSNNH